MDDRAKKISPLDVHASILIFMTCATIISNNSQQVMLQNAWINAIIGTIIACIYIYILLKLTSKFQNKTIIDINDIIYGKHIGKIISLLYISVILVQLIDSLVWMSFLFEIVIPDFSRVFSIVLFLSMCFLSMKNGIIYILRYAITLVGMGYVILILSFFLLLPHMNLSDFLPLDATLIDTIKANVYQGNYTYSELVYLFLFIFPLMSNISGVLYQKKKYVFLSLLIGGCVHDITF